MAEMKCWVPLIEYKFRDFLKTLDMLKVDKTHDLSSCWIKSFDSPRVSKVSGDVIPMRTKVSSCVSDVLQNLFVL